MYKIDLESDIKKEIKGDLRDILIQLLSKKKDKDNKINKNEVEQDAKEVHEVSFATFSLCHDRILSMKTKVHV